MKLPNVVLITANPESEFSQSIKGAVQELSIPLQVALSVNAELMENVDMALFAPDAKTEMEFVFSNEIVPVAPEGTPLCVNYHPNTEQGNSFLYDGSSVWVAFAAFVRALETFQFPYDWKHIVRNGIGTVRELKKNSISGTAQVY